ncbi:tRNA-splicing endonuclease subunit Sen15 isoform X1 [Rhineura floridana]|uniref:tRNA-splicing endonuclease subunit Sen15 isoform X1 n=1 Tax=Rhineura floridana TaxID=261503 RepID=UPI002AC86402|nr:tRNA-splicing endonuclease subunit Sen15 isoform X1 [Rhineura floridana]XP_061490035.1 tRNA-splicing endonuclease subunit Sen15 isoform X1 [Rhineura floridana]
MHKYICAFFQLQTHLDETDYLDPYQSGFRTGHGTETALVALVDDMRRALDRGEFTFLVLLDLSAAFDTVDHGILLDRLESLGLGGTVLRWFHSFLSDRCQQVALGDEVSDPWPLNCGVPQGSILSPMLFNIYVKPLGEIIRRFGLRCHQYADDTQLYLSFKSSLERAVETMSKCLESVSGWMGRNRLKLNPDKTEVLLVGDKGGLGDVDLVFDGVKLPLQDQVRSLGVVLDSRLSMEAQISAVSRATWYQLHLIRRLQPYLPVQQLPLVVHALVTSRLDYCNALYVGLPLKTTQKLQLVQNAAAHLLTNSRHRDHITPVLFDLHWLPVVFRARFKVLVLTFKTLYGFGPAYLKERLHRHHLCHPTRSATQGLLSIPPTKTVRLVGTRERAFSVVAPTLWNSLPCDLRHAPSLDVFRKALKTWLFQQAFEVLGRGKSP